MRKVFVLLIMGLFVIQDPLNPIRDNVYLID